MSLPQLSYTQPSDQGPARRPRRHCGPACRAGV